MGFHASLVIHPFFLLVFLPSNHMTRSLSEQARPSQSLPSASGPQNNPPRLRLGSRPAHFLPQPPHSDFHIRIRLVQGWIPRVTLVQLGE